MRTCRRSDVEIFLLLAATTTFVEARRILVDWLEQKLPELSYGAPCVERDLVGECSQISRRCRYRSPFGWFGVSKPAGAVFTRSFGRTPLERPR